MPSASVDPRETLVLAAVLYTLAPLTAHHLLRARRVRLPFSAKVKALIMYVFAALGEDLRYDLPAKDSH